MIEVDGKYYKEVRCTQCRKLLLHEYIFVGRLAVKCPRCKKLNTIEYRASKAIVEEAQKDFYRSNPDNEPINLLLKGREINNPQQKEGDK